MIATLERLETKTCSRCGGSGNYSYCQTHGTKCFQCGGAGDTYTKRGRAARAYLETIRSKTAGELLAGDVVRFQGIPGFTGDRWITVQAVTRSTLTSDFVDVEAHDRRGEICGWRGVRRDTLIRVAQSAERKTATYAAAVAYQATLTKAGKPRKRRA